MSLKLLNKVVSIFTLVAFLATNVAYAAPESKSIFKNKKVNYQKISDKNEGVIQQKKAVLTGENSKELKSQKREAQKILSSHLSDISLIHIPQELGKVVEVYQNPDHDNSRLIVYIQDLHTNPEATLNLAGILEILVRDYNLGLVCSEGADGVVDTSSVSSFPDPEVRKKVARLFVDSGELTGEEYLSITKYPDLPIWGIENKDIYFKNIEEFNNIMKFNPDSQVFISQAKKALEELKPKIYSRELLAIDQREADYENQKTETADHLKYLSNYIQKLNIPTANYKNIAILNETIDKESKIDQQKIMQESQNLLLNLQSAIAAKSSRSDMDTLVAKASLFKDQKISPFSFYSYLEDLANKHLKDQMSKYPNLMDFVDYLTKVNSLESVKLFVEMEDLSYEIKQRLAKNDEEKILTQALRSIKFLEGFFNLKISNEELDYYLQNKASCNIAFFEAFLKPAIKKYNLSDFVDFNPSLIDSHLQEIEDFYKTVKSRDQAMFTNTTSEVEKRNVRVATLITGGFHTQGITRLLKEKGYSYIVISPFSKTEIDEENYHFLLSGKRKPIEELIKDLDKPSEDKASQVSAKLRVPLNSAERLKDAISNVTNVSPILLYSSEKPEAYLTGKVIAIQGIGGTGGLLLRPLLEGGAIVIASDVDPIKVSAAIKEFKSYIDSNRLFVFSEDRLPNGAYTNKIMNPMKPFSYKLKTMGVNKIDVFSPCAVGPVVNPSSIEALKSAGVSIISGSCNNVTEDKQRDNQLLKQAGIAYVPDYIANAGGVTGVDGHLGHEVTNKAISMRISKRVADIINSSIATGRTTQDIADETSRKFFESLEKAETSNAQENPKKLDGLILGDGSTVKVLINKEDFSAEALKHWDNHYGVFEISNKNLGYTAYMSIHRFTKINSKAEIVNGQYRATGGTRIRNYKSNDDALIDALELSQEMSFKNAGALLAIGGSKCAINVSIDPRSNGRDAETRKLILISYAKAIEEIGRLIGGGVLTGQDVNISEDDAKLLFEYAPTSIVPYIAPELCIPPTPPTAVGVFISIATALKETGNLSFKPGKGASLASNSSLGLKEIKSAAIERLAGVLQKEDAIADKNKAAETIVEYLITARGVAVNTLKDIQFSDGPQYSGATDRMLHDIIIRGKGLSIVLTITNSTRFDPSEEFNDSKIASDLGLGPDFIYSEQGKPNKYLDMMIVEGLKQAGELTKEEEFLAGRKLAEKVYTMFDVSKETTVIHRLDNLTSHMFVVRRDGDIDVRFIDWGRAINVSAGNRRTYSQRFIYRFFEEIATSNLFKNPEVALAAFLSRLKEVALQNSREEFDYYNDLLDKVYAEAITKPISGLNNSAKYKALYEKANPLIGEINARLGNFSPASLTARKVGQAMKGAKGWLERGWTIANHILVSFHSAFILSVLVLPAVMRGEILSFMFFSPETLLSIGFLWASYHTGVAIHEMGHYVTSVKVGALNDQLLPEAEKMMQKSFLKRLAWHAKMFVLIPYGKFNGVIKTGLSYHPDAEYNLAQTAAGPRWSRNLAFIALPIAAILVGIGLFGGNVLATYIGRFVFGMGIVGYLDFKMADPGEYKKFRERERLAALRAEEATKKADKAGRWIDRVAEVKKRMIDSRPQMVRTKDGLLVWAPWQFRNCGMGGRHTEKQYPNSNISMQETMFNPLSPKNYEDAQEMTMKLQTRLQEIIETAEGCRVMGIGLEGGLAPYITKEAGDIVPEQRLWRMAKQAILDNGYIPGVDVAISLDPASSELENAYREENNDPKAIGMYLFWRDKEKVVMTREELYQFFRKTIEDEDIPIVSIEDGFAEDDDAGWKLIQQGLGDKLFIIGDDSVTTRDSSIEYAADNDLNNTFLCKGNQIGTLSETLLAILVALGKNLDIVVSHRSKSPNDDMEAQIALASFATGLKTGGGANTERLMKYGSVMRVMAEAVKDAQAATAEMAPDTRAEMLESEKIAGNLIDRLVITEVTGWEEATNAGIPTVKVRISFGIEGSERFKKLFVYEGSTPLGTSAGTGEAIHLVDSVIYESQIPDAKYKDLFSLKSDGSYRFKKGVTRDQIDALGDQALTELFRRSQRYDGKGCLNAVDHVNNTLAKDFTGLKLKDLGDLTDIDRKLLGLEMQIAQERGQLKEGASLDEKITIMQRKGNIGMNAILSQSLAAARLLAALQGKELYQVLREKLTETMAKTIAANGGLDILPEEIKKKVSIAQGQELWEALNEHLDFFELKRGLQIVNNNKSKDVKLYELLRGELPVYGDKAISRKSLASNEGLGNIAADYAYFEPKYVEAINLLVALHQEHLFASWDMPGVNDKLKKKFLEQVIEADSAYPGGLVQYQQNAVKIIGNSIKEVNVFEGLTPEIPEITNIDNTAGIGDKYKNLEKEGLKIADKFSIVLVAGGRGDRLGYSGIKIGIPLDLVTERRYIEHYLEGKKAIENAANTKIPFAIMTSDDNHESTKELLEELGYVVVSDNNSRTVMEKDGDKIDLIMQGLVPAITNIKGDFVLEDKYKLLSKPHGHGDVHVLISKYGLINEWIKSGKKYTVFIQDTNGQVLNAILSGLKITDEKGLGLNFITVPRDAGEAAGAITRLEPKGIVCNVEYNQLDPLLKESKKGMGDVADPVTGKSPYPANLNVYFIENGIYKKVLDMTKGIMPEFANPKFTDASKTSFQPTRLETMMQDIAMILPEGSKVAVVNYADKRAVFSPVKNSFSEAEKKIKTGNYPDHMATGESDYYKYNRKLIAFAGMQVDVEESEARAQGIVPYSEGAKVVFYRSFFTTADDVLSKIKGGSISNKSTLVIGGKNVYLEDVDIDGSLIINVVAGATLKVKGLKVQNEGWEFVQLTQEEMVSPDTPEYLKIRGYKLVKKGQKVIDIQEPGKYEIGSDGVLKKTNVNLASNAGLQKSLASNEALGNIAAYYSYFESKNIVLTYDQVGFLPERIKGYLAQQDSFIDDLKSDKISGKLQDAKFEIAKAGLQGIKDVPSKINYVDKNEDKMSMEDYAQVFNLALAQAQIEIGNISYYIDQFKPYELSHEVALLKIAGWITQGYKVIPFEFGGEEGLPTGKDLLEKSEKGLVKIFLIGSATGEEFIKIQPVNVSEKLSSNAGLSKKQQVDSMDQIIVVSARNVAADKKGFENWIETGLPANNTVVILAVSEEEADAVKEYEDIAYIKVIGKDINQEYGLKLIELFGTYGRSEFFEGFKLGVPASIDKYKSLAAEISSSV